MSDEIIIEGIAESKKTVEHRAALIVRFKLYTGCMVCGRLGRPFPAVCETCDTWANELRRKMWHRSGHLQTL